MIAPGLIAIYSTVQPVGTAILSFLFLGIRPTVGEVMGGVLVIAGLVLTVMARQIEDQVKRATHERRGSKETPLFPGEQALDAAPPEVSEPEVGVGEGDAHHSP